MGKIKPVILGAYENLCPMCGGIVYKRMTTIGVIYQCKYGCTYQKR